MDLGFRIRVMVPQQTFAGFSTPIRWRGSMGLGGQLRIDA